MAPPTTAIDPKVKVPEAVRRHAAAAQASFDAANNIQPAEPAPPAEVTPPVEAASPAPPAPPAPVVTPEVTPQEWEHRYNSMKGRYERSQVDVRTMSDQMAAMTTRLASLEASQVSHTPPELTPSSLLTQEEVTEYGVEFLGVVGKKALEQISPEVAALKKELSTLKAKVDGTVATTAATSRRNMEVSLDDKCPAWRDLNFKQEFHDWLKLPDPFSGAIRHELLTAAYERNNTPQVLAFFNGFLAQEAALAPALAGEPAPAADGKIPLETFAAPGRAKTAAASGAPVEKPTFTTAQITQFYADSRSGKFRGKEADYNRIEAAIFEAQREGRIR